MRSKPKPVGRVEQLLFFLAFSAFPPGFSYNKVQSHVVALMPSGRRGAGVWSFLLCLEYPVELAEPSGFMITDHLMPLAP